MSATQIRKFLLRQPRPSSLRIVCGDTEKIMEIGASPHWGEIAESVDALGPDTIEFLDKAGHFLRAVKCDQFADAAEDDKVQDKLAKQKLAFDGETERFRLVAELLADAHKFSEKAFDKLAAIVDSVTSSSAKKDAFIDSMQRAYSKVLEENADLAATAGEGDGDPMEFMMRAMLGGWMQSQAEKRTQQPAPQAPRPPPAPTNGASRQPVSQTKVRARA